MDSYDRDTGLVFKETIFKPTCQTPWEHQCIASNDRPPPAPLPTPGGTKSLYSLCMEELMRNTRSIFLETLQGIPAHIAVKIWTRIRREGLESFHVWKIFVEAGFGDRTFRHHLFPSGSPPRPLHEMYGAISSPNFAWVVDLALVDVRCSLSTLRHLASVTNLTSLQVRFSDSRKSVIFSDSVVQSWSNSATLEGAFARLELLLINNCTEITSSIFESLRRLPLLQQMLLCDTGVERSKSQRKLALKQGWRFDSTNEFWKPFCQDISWVRKISLNPSWHFIDEYVDWRHSQKSNLDGTVPVLKAGKHKPNHSRPYETDLLCFERTQLPLSAIDKRMIGKAAAPDENTSIPERRRPAKKRKINAAKAEGFSRMLEKD